MCLVMDAVGVRIIRKDSADNRKGGGVATVVKDTIKAVAHPLPNIPANDVLACDIGPPESRMKIICFH